jgi:predicted small lipoprotein YifL
VLALIALGSVGCGRRGALEPPPDPNAVVKPDNDPSHPQVHHKPKPVTPPKQPFFLDFLL